LNVRFPDFVGLETVPPIFAVRIAFNSFIGISSLIGIPNCRDSAPCFSPTFCIHLFAIYITLITCLFMILFKIIYSFLFVAGGFCATRPNIICCKFAIGFLICQYSGLCLRRLRIRCLSSSSIGGGTLYSVGCGVTPYLYSGGLYSGGDGTLYSVGCGVTPYLYSGGLYSGSLYSGGDINGKKMDTKSRTEAWRTVAAVGYSYQ